MYTVDLYRRVRRAHFVEGMSIREAARVFGLHRDTLNKMLESRMGQRGKRGVRPGAETDGELPEARGPQRRRRCP